MAGCSLLHGAGLTGEKVAKTCLGWENVQVLAYEAARLLVALNWVAAGFLFDLGVTLEWGEVRLRRPGGARCARTGRPARSG